MMKSAPQAGEAWAYWVPPRARGGSTLSVEGVQATGWVERDLAAEGTEPANELVDLRWPRGDGRAVHRSGRLLRAGNVQVAPPIMRQTEGENSNGGAVDRPRARLPVNGGVPLRGSVWWQ
jgi:hypothetical protein